MGMFIRTGEVIYWNELTDFLHSPFLFDMNFTPSQMKNDVAELPWRSWQIPLNDYDLEVTFSCCSNPINGYYKTFSDMVFGFRYLLLWHYSCLPLYFCQCTYTSVLFEKTNLIERRLIETISKMICFIIYPPCPVWLACYMQYKWNIRFLLLCPFIIKINTKISFSFVSYLLGYWVFWNYDR